MEITHSSNSGFTIIHIKGNLDLYSSPEVRTAVEDLVNKGANKVILDLTAVSYVDSTGISNLIELNKVIGKNGFMSLIGLSKKVKELLEITRLTSLFNIRETVQDVIDSQ